MVIEYSIPNGTMKINAKEFFLHATKAKIQKVLGQYKKSGAAREDFWKLLRWVIKQKGLVEGDRLLLMIEQDERSEKLAWCRELYEKMKDPACPEYTEDKKLRLSARDEMNSAKSGLNETKRRIAEGMKQEARWDLCREMIETIIDSLQEVK